MKQVKIFILGIVVILVGFGWYFSQKHVSQDEPAEVGKSAPDFTLKNAAGQSVRLSDYRGKFVVLNFWGTWCPPCVEEAPFLEQLNQRFVATTPQRITVLTVSVDSDWDPVNKFSQEHNLSFPILLDTHQSVPHQYGTFKYPETYIIDPSGIVRGKIIGAYNWMAPEALQYFDSLLRS
ncbi:MAG: TlpA family protein disulfide reductase [Acidobacteriia bacterium]|nr:TlpA family protein disulfide reductase [Terriglobia bacterium]